MAPGWFVPLGA